MKIFATDLPSDVKERVVETAETTVPKVLPADWARLESYANGGMFQSRGGVRVIVEVEAHDRAIGGFELWIHVSVSRKDRVPMYDEMKRVKELFVGRDRKAVQILPSDKEHFNFHPNCLHMWSPIDRDPLPDFRTATGEL